MAGRGGMKTRGFMEPNIKQQLQAQQYFNAPPNPFMLLFMADLWLQPPPCSLFFFKFNFSAGVLFSMRHNPSGCSMTSYRRQTISWHARLRCQNRALKKKELSWYLVEGRKKKHLRTFWPWESLCCLVVGSVTHLHGPEHHHSKNINELTCCSLLWNAACGYCRVKHIEYIWWDICWYRVSRFVCWWWANRSGTIP